MKKSKKTFIVGLALIVLFALFTVAVALIDVEPIGPGGSEVGFSHVNAFFFDLFGENTVWYSATNILGAVAIAVAVGFCVFGLCLAVKRRSVFKVDKDILLLGVYYIAVVAVYVFFEIFVVNYRPIITDNALEASYPSSHTAVVCCIMSAAFLQFKKRIKNKAVRRIICVLTVAVTAFTVVGRLLSGAHWFTDIVGGLILSAGLIALYYGAVLLADSASEK